MGRSLRHGSIRERQSNVLALQIAQPLGQQSLFRLDGLQEFSELPCGNSEGGGMSCGGAGAVRWWRA